MVTVDTRNGIIQGQVARIDPSAREGTFTIDASLNAPLPPSARPDVGVDGQLFWSAWTNVLHVGRPHLARDSQLLAFSS